MVEKLHRRSEVQYLTGLSGSTIYRLMAQGKFPRPKRIGAKAVAWTDSGLSKWMDERETA